MIIKSDADDYKQIIEDKFPHSDFEALINNEHVDCQNKKCKLKSGINTITIKFKEIIISCHSMFHGAKGLLELDFSELDTSEVANMSYMFRDCNELKSLDIFILNNTVKNNEEDYRKKMRK